MNENEILESCLESLKKGASLASCLQAHPELSDESLAILQAAARLQAAGQTLTPAPAFKRRARGDLMQRIAAEQREAIAASSAAAPGLRQRWQRFLSGFSSSGMHWQPLAAAVALVLFFALSVGVFAAAQKAQPGDLLYPVKQLTEQMNAITGRDATPTAATPPPTASPPPTSSRPTATAQLTPATPASGLPIVTPTTVLTAKPPATPVPPTATLMPPTSTMPPTMAPTMIPTMPPTLAPTMAPTLAPTMVPTTPPTMPPATATSMPPTPTMPMPTPTAAPPTPTMPMPTPTAAPPTATAVPAPTMNPTQSPPTPPSWP